MLREVLFTLLTFTNYVVLGYFVFVAVNYMGTSGYAFVRLYRYRRRLASFHTDEAIGAATAPPITVLAPMYNEAAVCVEAARSMLAVKYPRHDVLLCNDGSKDATVERLVAEFDMVPTPRFPTAELPTARVRAVYRSRRHPNLWLIDKENGGRSDALNAGLNFCQTPLVCAIDADSLFDRDALLRAVRPFQEDASTIAVGGNIRIVNDCDVQAGVVQRVRMPRRLVARFQVLEYLRAFVCSRVGWDAMGMLMIISGAFGLFRRSLLVEVGGFSTKTIGEDMELVFRLHQHCRDRQIPYRMRFVPDAVVWTECPDTTAVLGRQRDRWHRGLAQVLLKYRAMLLNPRYGRPGVLGYPFFLFVEFFGPVIEAAGYVSFAASMAFGLLDPVRTLLLLLLALSFGILHSISSVAMEEMAFRRYTRFTDLLQLIGLTVLENFGYRQLTVYWRLRGIYLYLRGNHSWGEMTRTGFSSPPTSP